MAGRGTDIKLAEGVKDLGGYILLGLKDTNQEELICNFVVEVVGR